MAYELMVIGNPKVEVDALQTLVEKVLHTTNVTNFSIEKLGKKKLVFPIAKQTEAEYLVFNIEGETSIVSEINQKLRLEQETVLRYMIVKKESAKIPFSSASTPINTTHEKKASLDKYASQALAPESKAKVEKSGQINGNTVGKTKKVTKKSTAESIKAKRKS